MLKSTTTTGSWISTLGSQVASGHEEAVTTTSIRTIADTPTDSTIKQYVPFIYYNRSQVHYTDYCAGTPYRKS